MKETSLEAHETVKPKKATHQQIIINVMLRNKRPLTSEQIAVQCNLSHQQVWKRLSEMASTKNGKTPTIRITTIRMRNSSGSDAFAWEIIGKQLNAF